MNQRGSAIPFATMLSSAMLIGAVFALSNSGYLMKINRQAFITQSMEVTKKNVQVLIQDNSAWLKTIKDPVNTSLDCLDPDLPAMNCDPAGGPFTLQIRDGADQIYIGINNGGLDLGGTYCNSFDAVAGSDACPFQFVITWTPVCPNGGACTNPMVHISGSLIYKPGPGLQTEIGVNVDQYQFSMTR